MNRPFPCDGTGIFKENDEPIRQRQIVRHLGDHGKVVGDIDGGRENLAEGDLVYRGNILETSSNGALGIVLANETVFTVGPGSRMVLDPLIFDPMGQSSGASVTILHGSTGLPEGFPEGRILTASSLRLKKRYGFLGAGHPRRWALACFPGIVMKFQVWRLTGGQSAGSSPISWSPCLRCLPVNLRPAISPLFGRFDRHLN